MKNTQTILVLVIAMILTSCATTIKFPVSDTIPSAEIFAAKKQDKHDNCKITVTAKYLASPERLKPPKKTYVVWIKTEQGVKNVGQLKNKNAKKAELVTLSPFDVSEIFITAEEKGNISYPAGIEISRTSFD